MNISTTKAHPKGKGRPVNKSYSINGCGSSASGNGKLPDDTDSVSILAYADDGVDKSSSSHVYITFGLDDEPDHLDGLIRKLTALRLKQDRDRALNDNEKALVAKHDIIGAIKAVRERTGLGLKDSKDRVDAYRRF